jgi:hypothetical protein
MINSDILSSPDHGCQPETSLHSNAGSLVVRLGARIHIPDYGKSVNVRFWKNYIDPADGDDFH